VANVKTDPAAADTLIERLDTAPVSELPIWARLLDALAGTVLLIGVSVFFNGGFRTSTVIGRVSVMSWPRPVAIAFAIVIVRHLLWRQPSIASRVGRFIERWRRSEEIRVVRPVVLSTRLGVLAVGFLGIVLLGYAPHTPPYRVYQNDFLNMPARWDTGWFWGIARDGYQFDPSARDKMQDVAFFPLYPLLMRYGSLIAGGHVLWVGVAISLLSFFWSAILLYRLARRHLSHDAAAAGVAFLATYPFALFFSTAYTESLYLLTVVAACYHFERDELWKAASWGFAAGLTRPNGCLLSVVLAVMAVERWRTIGLPLQRRLVVAAAPGLAMVLFSAYMYFLTGNPLQWAAQHAAWGRVYRGVDIVIAEQFQYARQGLYAYAASRPLDLLHACVVVLMISSIVPVYRLLGAPYAAMIALNILPPLAIGGLLSMGRVSSVVFPTFLWLGSAVPLRHRAAWLIGFAMLQALCAIAFFTWRPLY
jgi:hypothetical protein